MSLPVKSLRSKISKSLFSYLFLSMICCFEPKLLEIQILQSSFFSQTHPKNCILFQKKSNLKKMSLPVKSLRSKILKSLFSYLFLSMICCFEPNLVEIQILQSRFFLKPIQKITILFKKNRILKN